MKQMREQIKLLKAAHGPIVTQPPSSYPKVTEDRRSKGGKISQPQRRHIKKDDTVQVSGIPDTIAMDLSKLNPFGSFTFGCEAWTISFDRNPKFKKFFFEGNKLTSFVAVTIISVNFTFSKLPITFKVHYISFCNPLIPYCWIHKHFSACFGPSKTIYFWFIIKLQTSSKWRDRCAIPKHCSFFIVCEMI